MVRQASVQTVEDNSDVDMDQQKLTAPSNGRSSRSKSASVRNHRDSSVIEVLPNNDASTSSSKRQTTKAAAVVVEEPFTRFFLDCVELPTLSDTEKAEYEHGRFLTAVPGEPDLPAEDYVIKPALAATRKPRWKTIADTSEGEDEEDMPRPKRSRNDTNYKGAASGVDRVDLDGDFDSIESESSEEVEDVDLESEGNEWDRRPRETRMRTSVRRRRGNAEIESIESGSDTVPTGRGRGKAKASPIEVSSDGDDFDEILDELEDEVDDPELTEKHRPTCHKCNFKPSHDMYRALMQKRKKKGYRKKSKVDDLLMNDDDLIDKLGGWTECRRCCTSLHWNCLPSHFRNELLAQDKKLEFKDRNMPSGRLRMDHKIVIDCPHCIAPISKNCYVCWTDDKHDGAKLINTGEVDPKGKGVDRGTEPASESNKDLLFRCVRCFRAAHYEHLPSLDPEKGNPSALVLADQYQPGKPKIGWHCQDCRRLPHDIEYIIAWRYSPPEAKDDKYDEDLHPAAQHLRREYLLKLKGWGFRHATWVAHDYVVQTANQKARYFIDNGSRLQIKTETELANGADELADDEEAVLKVDGDADQIDGDDERPLPKPEADRDLPRAWSTPDRILDLWFLTGKPVKSSKMKLNRVESPEPEPEGVRYDFVKPDDSTLIHIDDWERRNRKTLGPDDAQDLVSRIGLVYVKWQDLQYEAATEDTPIAPNSPFYPAFLSAFRNYLYARTVKIPILTKAEAKARDARKIDGYQRLMGIQPDCVTNGTLMGFQIDGLDWLMNKWYNLTSVILADDMGLGKTVQIAAFLGLLGSGAWNVYPALVVVPNSTLQNWLREFAKWVPHLRVVPIQGTKESREIIRKYEMFSAKGDLKCHVVLATYEIVTSQKDFSVLLNKVPRWESLIVDEASRLKSQTNLIVRKLTQLQPVHKVLLTGTPLNNTVRELLNLMYFLDSEEWSNLDELEKHYAEMTEDLAKELREKIAPYMLRRRKEDVLDLPPKNEIIVPLTMRPLQRNVYKSILEKNADLMQALAQATTRGGAPLKMKACHNILMQLRKCLQHPFLNTPELEDRTLGNKETHQALIDASGKLTFLKTLLPKLKAKGHRILLFSQFVIALNIIEDFCDGEGYRTLRLDGTTPQDQRQRDIDTFNAPDSEHFLYLISTRAGGMGINLATADTVIVHDLDFNPHQDMQAIARAYRYGQKNKVLVMRFMTTPTVEERMMQIAKKKLVLDHLIVQAKDSDSSDNIASILLDGARAILDGTDTDDKTYDDQAVEELITKLETGEDEKSKDESGFTFAAVFDNKKGKLQALKTDDAAKPEDPDFWAKVVKRANEERIKRETEEHGRGKRKRAAANLTIHIDDDNEQPSKKSAAAKNKKKGSKDQVNSEGSDYQFKDNEVESDLEVDALEVAREMQGELQPGQPGPSSRKTIVKTAKSPEKAQKVARPAHRRRLSAKGEELRRQGDPMQLGFYHLNRVHELAQRFGLYSREKLNKLLGAITDSSKTGEERIAEYAKAAKVIDDHLEIQGQPRICGSNKTMAEIRVLLIQTSQPRKPKLKPAPAAKRNAVPSAPVQPPPSICPSCGAVVPSHGACFKCIAGIQSQIRIVEMSTEDNEEDKNEALRQLEGMLNDIRARSGPTQPTS